MDILDRVKQLQNIFEDDPSSMAQEPRNMFADGQLVRPNADGSRPGYNGKLSVIELQSQGGPVLEQPKYKTNLTKALAEVDLREKKGYGNIDGIVKKYQKIFSEKVGSKTRIGKTVTTGVGSRQRKAITFAIREYAKKLNIQSINNLNVVKALDAYTKLENPKRGDLVRISKKYNAPKGSFEKYLTNLDLRKKIPLQFGSEAEKKKYYAKLRNDAIDEFSSQKFEKFLSAPETSLVQKSHMGDLYNQYVRTGNLGYAPNLINQETLKDVDAILKEYNEQINDLFKNKPKDYRNKIDLLNQKGNDLAAATQGYKKFTGKDPFTGKEFTINFSKPSQELDPTDLFNNKNLSDLTAADKPTLEILKEEAMKNSKLSKTKTNKISKEILSQLEKLGCGKAAGGRILFSKGTPGGRLTECAMEGQKKIDRIIATGKGTKEELSMAKKLLKFGKEAVSLRGLFGPQATALFALTEAGLTGYDVAKGKPLKEAIGKNLNYLLGPKWKQDVDELEYKRLEGSGVDINQLKLLKNSYKPFEELGDLYNKQYQLEMNTGNPQGRLGNRPRGTQKSRAERLQEVNSQIADMYMAKGPQQISTLIRATEIQNDPSILANRKDATDILAAQEFDRSILPEAKGFYANERFRKEKEKERLALQTTDKEVEEAFGFNANGVQTFSELNKLMSTMPEYADQSYGITKVGPQTGYNVKDAYNEARKYLDSFKPEFGYHGSQEGANLKTRYAGGGIAGLSGGDKSGPPPESGPTSQGLRSLYKNGRKL